MMSLVAQNHTALGILRGNLFYLLIRIQFVLYVLSNFSDNDPVPLPKEISFKEVKPLWRLLPADNLFTSVASNRVAKPSTVVSAPYIKPDLSSSEIDFKLSVCTYDALQRGETPKLEPGWCSQDLIVEIMWIATALDKQLAVVQKVDSALRCVKLLNEERLVTLRCD